MAEGINQPRLKEFAQPDPFLRYKIAMVDVLPGARQVKPDVYSSKAAGDDDRLPCLHVPLRHFTKTPDILPAVRVYFFSGATISVLRSSSNRDR